MVPRSGQFADDRCRCVLIVDDDPMFAVLAGETLRQAGFDSLVAGNRRGALELLETAAIDLVLLDVELPDGSGFDVCASIRASAAGLDVPVVMVTGRDDTGSIARAYAAGATDFLSKPLLWPMLPHRVGFILRAGDTLRALRASEHKNRALLQALPDSIYIVDDAGTITALITGDSRTAGGGLLGRRLDQIVPAEVAAAARVSMDAAGMGEWITHEFDLGCVPDARTLEARLCRQVDGTFLVVIRDATERRRAEAQIEYLAYYDTLTGLPNRQLFVRDVGRAMTAAARSGGMFALLYLDLDRFKRINDNLGHSVGDALLRSVARRLESSLRPAAGARGTQSDLYQQNHIARLGGDEFVILLTGVALHSQVTAVATRIEQALCEPFECEGHQFVVTPSIGIALYPADGTDIDDLLVKADMAMYQAKDQGRNGHAYYGESMAVRSLGRLELESELRRAFEANSFELHYQPKMTLSTGAIVGVEALLRWHHPERGWIPPDKFIPVAEETGIIVPLGDWVVRETCRQLQEWAAGDLKHLSIAVNVSVQQFAKQDFVDRILRTLWQYGVRPQQLELEITESLLMRDVDGTRAALKRLGDAGLSLSIDDFGTGYSSLGYLRQFPVDALKIDRSFVQDLPASSDAAAICAAIIAMAGELKLKVIAEGVETVEQLEFLRMHRCDEAQGYLIGRPVGAADLARLLRDAAHTRAAARLLGTQAT